MIKKILIASAFILGSLIAFSVSAAPTSTIVQNLFITGLSGNGTTCLHILNSGLVQVAGSDCGTGSGGGASTTINGATTSTFLLIAGQGITSTQSGATTTFILNIGAGCSGNQFVATISPTGTISCATPSGGASSTNVFGTAGVTVVQVGVNATSSIDENYANIWTALQTMSSSIRVNGTSTFATLNGSTVIIGNGTGTSTCLTCITAVATYGSSNLNLQDGVLNVNGTNSSATVVQFYRGANTNAVAPVAMIIDQDANELQPILLVQATSSNPSATTVQLTQNGYVTVGFKDTSQANATGKGKFQLNDRNNVFRFESRNAANNSFDVNGLYSQVQGGNEWVLGGYGDIFSLPANAGTLNVVQSSSSIPYFTISTTSTNIGNVLQVDKNGLLTTNFGATINGAVTLASTTNALLLVNSTGVVSGFGGSSCGANTALQVLSASGTVTCISVASAATSTIQVSTTTLTGPAFIFGTSTLAGTWTIQASGTSAFKWIIPPAGDQYFAPSTTIPTNTNQLTNGAGFITTSTNNFGGLTNASITANAPITWSGGSVIGFNTSTALSLSGLYTFIGGITANSTATFNSSTILNATGTLIATNGTGLVISYIGSTCGASQAPNGISASGTVTGCFTPTGGGSGGLVSSTPWTVSSIPFVLDGNTLQGSAAFTNASATNQLRYVAQGGLNAGNSQSVGGDINFNFNNATNAGITIYSNQGASQGGNLIRGMCDNPLWAANVDCVNYQSSANTSTVLQVTGSSTNKGVIKGTLNPNLAGVDQSNASVYSGLVNSTSGQLFFGDTSASGTSGKLLNIRDKGIEYLVLQPEGSGFTINTTSTLASSTIVGTGATVFSTNPTNMKSYAAVGSSTVASTIGGTLSFSATSTGNGAGASTTVETYNIPTSTFLTIGDEIDVFAGGVFSASANTNKELNISVASTTIFDTGAAFAPANVACNWFLESRGMANMAIPTTNPATSTIMWVTQFTDSCSNALTDDSGDAGNKTVTATTTAPINITMFANGTSAGDVTSTYFRVMYNPF